MEGATGRMGRRVVRLAMIVAVVLGTAGHPRSAEAVESSAADIEPLCTGLAACADAGYSSAGYADAIDRQHWGMTAGHNCTNYAAYRLTHGRITVKPDGTGSARTWGTVRGVTVDDTPEPGDVAWWRADANGASRSGHVAVVERVLPDGDVVVSQDNLGGDFGWARLAAHGAYWPSGFITYPESDGSPTGGLTGILQTSPGVLQVTARATDPDATTSKVEQELVLTGADGTETVRFTAPHVSYRWNLRVASRGDVTATLRARNVTGSAGEATELGTTRVRVRGASAVRSALEDDTIRRTARPVVRFRVLPGAVSGTVEVRRGSRVLASVRVAGERTYRVVLPRQPSGRTTLSVHYRGSDRLVGSTASPLRLTVR